MQSIRIILFATAAAILYGILHDQVTAHLCVEYFTIAHPPVFPTTSPFLLAVGWGVIATWWVGLPLGVLLAAAARLGRHNRLTVSQLKRPILLLMAVSAIAALIAGIACAAMVAAGSMAVPGGWGNVIPPEKHVAFSAAAGAHLASYLSGFIGGLVLIGLTIRRRFVADRYSVPTSI